MQTKIIISLVILQQFESLVTKISTINQKNKPQMKKILKETLNPSLKPA